MVNISVSAASVLKGAGAKTNVGTAGATITAGQPLYMVNREPDTLRLADANLSAAAAAVVGIALHGAFSGQPIEYVVEDGDFTPGATLTVGRVYVLRADVKGWRGRRGDRVLRVKYGVASRANEV